MGFDPVSLAAIGGIASLGAATKTFFDKPKKAAPRAAEPTGPTPAEIDKRKDEDERRRRIRLQAGKTPGQLTPPGGATGEGTVARKALLGL